MPVYESLLQAEYTVTYDGGTKVHDWDAEYTKGMNCEQTENRCSR